LTERPLRIFKETQLLDFFNPIEQPTAWPMAAMIGGRKCCFWSVFSLEHPRRMRHANKKHRIFAGVAGRLVHSPPGMLFQHVVDVLHACDVAITNTIRSLIQPANRRPKRYAVIKEFSGRL